MSDMYLELRSRIPIVAQKSRIGTARLQDAQDSVGLSNERIAQKVPVSEKTWRRWKQDGEVPTYALPALARVLRLDLVEAPHVPVQQETLEPSLEDRLEELADAVRQLLEGQETVMQNLATLRGSLDAALAPQPAQPRRSR